MYFCSSNDSVCLVYVEHLRSRLQTWNLSNLIQNIKINILEVPKSVCVDLNSITQTTSNIGILVIIRLNRAFGNVVLY